MRAIAYFILPDAVLVIKTVDTSHDTLYLHEDHLALRHRTLLLCHLDILLILFSHGFIDAGIVHCQVDTVSLLLGIEDSDSFRKFPRIVTDKVGEINDDRFASSVNLDTIR